MASATLLEWHAREALGMGEDWHAYEWRAERNPIDNTLSYYQVRGCVAPLKTRGPSKGQPNFRKPAPGTDRTAYFTPQQQDAWEAAWQQQTGKCRACLGEGAVTWRYHVKTGAEKRPCTACQGTGETHAVSVEERRV